jgi:hypothetical protein
MRFYFDIRVGKATIKDRDGQELPDLDAAERQATEAAAAIGCDELVHTGTKKVVVEVRSAGRRVLTATSIISNEVSRQDKMQSGR